MRREDPRTRRCRKKGWGLQDSRTATRIRDEERHQCPGCWISCPFGPSGKPMQDGDFHGLSIL